MTDERSNLTEPASPERAKAYIATRGLRGGRIISPTADDLIDLLAHDLLEAARQRTSRSGVFHLALSGGSTPQALYSRLMIDPRYRLMPWPLTHIWIVDDRCVSFDDERSNYRMIREFIVEHVNIPDNHVHAMRVLEPAGDREYEADLRAALTNREAEGRLDYVLLGMGGDGHTASLFPQTPALRETERWAVFNDGEAMAAPRPRMTMTFPLINAARQIAVLVTGESKHAMLQRVAVSSDSPDAVARLPITGVRPEHEDGKLTWFLDYPAAVGPKMAAEQ